jgi:hypothetical protein
LAGLYLIQNFRGKHSKQFLVGELKIDCVVVVVVVVQSG